MRRRRLRNLRENRVYTVISKPNCPFCDQAKALLKQKHIDYKELIVDVGQTKEVTSEYITRETLFAMIPGVRTVPQILDDQTVIGGFNELRSLFESRTA